ncbi:MAG: hypothetical protein ACRBF0_12820 [Calditrichia bacterium]
MAMHVLERQILVATNQLIDCTRDFCWNTIPNSCAYILSDVTFRDGESLKDSMKRRNKENHKKMPSELTTLLSTLLALYPKIHEINLEIYRVIEEQTIVDIRYILHDPQYGLREKDHEVDVNWKIPIPPYADKYFTSLGREPGGHRKFDVNWQVSGLKHYWRLFWFGMQVRIGRFTDF